MPDADVGREVHLPARTLGLGVGGRLREHIEQNLSRINAAAAGLVAGGIKAWPAARPVYRFKDDIKGLVLKASVRTSPSRAIRL